MTIGGSCGDSRKRGWSGGAADDFGKRCPAAAASGAQLGQTSKATALKVIVDWPKTIGKSTSCGSLEKPDQKLTSFKEHRSEEQRAARQKLELQKRPVHCAARWAKTRICGLLGRRDELHI